ncbi:MAG: phosphatidate cytidylyltransferase [Zoogloeaceae bacterium]|nr:phosphatidate cytidylyltransferase [Zoogloeaceae bacterium]
MLKLRVITALILLAGFLAALLFLPPMGWLAFAAAVGALGAWEWGGLAGWGRPMKAAFSPLIGILIAGGGILAGLAQPTPSAHPALAGAYAAAVLFWLVVVPLWLSRKWRLQSTVVALVVGMVVLVPAALALAHLRQIGPGFLFWSLGAVWLADIGAYFSGRAWGRHKLAPNISPGKTWEGAVGGAALVVTYGLGMVWLSGWLGEDARKFVIFAFCLLGFAALSVQGDLFESLLKRQAGLKDSGQILPGHGGILDRIDSLTSTLPLVGLVIYFLPP